MAGINCVDAPVGLAAPLFLQGLAFQNPVLPILQSVNTSLLGLALLDPISAACAVQLQECLGMFQEYTNFMSGVTPVFPPSVLSSPFLSLPAVAGGLLSAYTFTQMLGALGGGLNAQKAMCQADATNPCALVSDVFNVVMAPATTILNAANATLGDITSLTSTVCNWVAGVIASLANLVTASINAIINALQIAENYALGKLFQFLSGQPCFTQFLEAIATPALQSALTITP